MIYNDKKFRGFLKELNKLFQYDREENPYGYKEIWSELDKGFTKDCEIYVLKIRSNYGGILYKADLIGGGTHTILELPCGRFIDNIQKRRVSRRYLERRGYMIRKKYSWLHTLYKQFLSIF